MVTTYDRRFDHWDTLENGKLLKSAEADNFDLIVTGDTKMFKQQPNSRRVIAYLVLSTTKWQILRQYAHLIADAVARAVPKGQEYLQLGPAPIRTSLKRPAERIE